MVMDAGQLSDEVEQVLMKVLGGSGDELDVADFNVTEYINRHFPDEASLDRADGFVQRWVHEAGKLEEQLFSAVRDQASAGERAAKDIKAARDSIDDLKQRTDLIREKSEASESLVQEISKDIKELDNAKTNLDKAIATIDKIQMLSTSLIQLKALAEDGTYAGVGRLLEVVAQILTHFSGYSDEVPQVKELHQQYDDVKSVFRRKIQENFELLTEEAVAELVGVEEAAQADAGQDRRRSRGGSSSYAGLGAGSPSTAPKLPPDGAMAKLRAACEVIDALGGEVLRDRLGEFCRKELKPYREQFRQGDAQSLDAVDRRFSWFRRKIRDLEARFGEVFPKHWRLSHRLCLQFCDQTRTDFDSILSKYESPDDVPPELVVRALQRTLEFEKEQAKRYERDLPPSVFGEEDDGGSGSGGGSGPASGAGAGGPDSNGYGYGAGGMAQEEEFDPNAPLINDDGAVVDPGTAEGIKLKYRRKREWEESKRRKTEQLSADEAQKQWLQQLGTGEREVGADSKKALDALPGIRRLHRAISDVFDPYTGAYVRLEQRNFKALVEKVATEKITAGEADGEKSDDRLVILDSAMGLVNQVKSSVKRCVQLGTGEILFQLYLEAKKTLGQYHEALGKHVPQPTQRAGPLGPVSTPTYSVPPPPSDAGGSASGAASGGAGAGADGRPARAVPLAQGAIATVQRLCAVVSTAEFMAQACEALGENFSARLEDEFKSSVNMEDSEDLFYKLLVDANQAMAGYCASLLDHHVATIRETDLRNMEQVTDKSWVGPLGVTMRYMFPLVRKRINSVYYRQFLDRFGKAFIPRYMAGVYRVKSVNEVGAQQMLMDSQTVRQLLLSCPCAKTPEEEEEDIEVPALPSHYQRHVQKELPRIDLLLKLLAVPQARLAESFDALWKTATEEELAKVMDLKCIETRAQQDILKKLGKDPRKAGNGGDTGSLVENFQRRLKENTPEDVPRRSRTPILLRTSPSDMLRHLERRHAEADNLVDGMDDNEVKMLGHPLSCMAVLMLVPGPTCNTGLAPGVARTICEATEKTITQHALSDEVSRAVRRPNRTFIDYYWIDTNEHAEEVRQWIESGIDLPQPPTGAPFPRSRDGVELVPQLQGWSHDIRLVRYSGMPRHMATDEIRDRLLIDNDMRRDMLDYVSKHLPKRDQMDPRWAFLEVPQAFFNETEEAASPQIPVQDPTAKVPYPGFPAGTLAQARAAINQGDKEAAENLFFFPIVEGMVSMSGKEHFGNESHIALQAEAEASAGRLREGLSGDVVPFGTLDGLHGGVAGVEGAEHAFLWQSSGLFRLPPGYAANNLQVMSPKYHVWTTPEDVSMTCITHCGPVVPMGARLEQHREFLRMAMSGGMQGEGGASAAALQSLAGAGQQSMQRTLKILDDGGIDLDGDGIVDVLASASKSGPSLDAPGMQIFKDDSQADLADTRMVDGSSVLLEICKRNDPQMAQAFMEMGARPDAPSRPLRYSVLQSMLAVRPDFGASDDERRRAQAQPGYQETTSHDQAKIVQLLLDFGADPNFANVLGHTAAHTIVVHHSSTSPEVRAMQQAGAPGEIVERAQDISQLENTLRRRMLKEIVTSGGRMCDRDALGQTPLHLAVAQNDIEALKFLVKQPGFQSTTKARNLNMSEILAEAQETGVLPSLEPPAGPRGVDDIGKSGAAECDILAADLTGNTPLASMLGIASSTISTMRMMQSMPAPPDELDKLLEAEQQHEASGKAIAASSYEEAAQQYGGSSSSSQIKSITYSMLVNRMATDGVSMAGVVRQLIDVCKQPLGRNGAALQDQEEDLIDLYGEEQDDEERQDDYADPYGDEFGRFTDEQANEEEDEDENEAGFQTDDSIFQRHPVSLTPGEQGRLGAPLRKMQSGHAALKKMVTAGDGAHYYGCGLDLTSSNGLSILHVAAMTGDFPTVELLLVAGANPNVMSSHGATPLHYAAPRGFTRVVHALLQHPSIDPNRPDAAGRTAMDLLCLQGFLLDDVWDMLEKAGAKADIPVCSAAETSLERDVSGSAKRIESHLHPLDESIEQSEVFSTGGGMDAVRTGARQLSPSLDGHLLPIVPYEVALQLVETDEDEGVDGASVVEMQTRAKLAAQAAATKDFATMRALQDATFPRVWIPRQVVAQKRNRWVRRRARRQVRNLLVTTSDLMYLEDDEDMWGHIADLIDARVLEDGSSLDGALVRFAQQSRDSPPTMEPGRQLLLHIATGHVARSRKQMSALEWRATVLRPVDASSALAGVSSPRQLGRELSDVWATLTHPSWRLRGAAMEAATSARVQSLLPSAVAAAEAAEPDADTSGETAVGSSSGLADTCDIDVIDDISRLTPETFIRDYVIPSRPVLIRNALNSTSQWWRRFDPTQFVKDEGHLKIKIGTIPYSRQFQLPDLELTMIEFLQYMRSPSTSSVAVRFADELVKQNDRMRKMKRQQRQKKKRRRRRRGVSEDSESASKKNAGQYDPAEIGEDSSDEEVVAMGSFSDGQSGSSKNQTDVSAAGDQREEEDEMSAERVRLLEEQRNRMARDRYLYGDGIRAEIEESLLSQNSSDVEIEGVDAALSPFGRLSDEKQREAGTLRNRLSWDHGKDPLYVSNDFGVDDELKQRLLDFPHIYSPRLMRPVNQQLFIGPPGSGAPPHLHSAALAFLLSGTKRWFLLPPSKAVYTRRSISGWWLGDRLVGDIDGVTPQGMAKVDELPQAPLECTQQAGDVMFVGYLWSHAVLNLKSSVGLSVEFSLTQGEVEDVREGGVNHLVEMGLTRPDAIDKVKQAFVAGLAISG